MKMTAHSRSDWMHSVLRRCCIVALFKRLSVEEKYQTFNDGAPATVTVSSQW